MRSGPSASSPAPSSRTVSSPTTIARRADVAERDAGADSGSPARASRSANGSDGLELDRSSLGAKDVDEVVGVGLDDDAVAVAFRRHVDDAVAVAVEADHVTTLELPARVAELPAPVR